MESASTARTTYGKACATCARVKYKCVQRVQGDGCERCHRLKKACQPSMYQRKRKLDDALWPGPERHIGQSARAATTIRTASAQGASSGSLHTDAITPDIVYDASGPLLTAMNTKGSPLTPASYSEDPSVVIASQCTYSTLAADVGLHDVPEALADEQLDLFRQNFLARLPFMHISKGMRAADLRQQMPFVWLVIMSLTTKSSAQQILMGDAIRDIVAKRIVLGCEKSLDAVLALICYIGWFQLHRKDKASLVMWTQIAVSIFTELGLHKEPAQSQEDFDTAQFSTKYTSFPRKRPISDVRTLEERRTALAVWLTTSMWVITSVDMFHLLTEKRSWHSHRQTESMRWTPYLESCVRVLEEEKDSQLDRLLILQVKCHLIMDQVGRAKTAAAEEGRPRQLPAYFVEAMRSQLRDLSADTASKLQDDVVAQLYLLSTENIVNEAIVKPRMASSNILDVARLDSFQALLDSIERYLNVFHGISPRYRLGITMHISAQQSHAIVTLFRLSTIQELGWDTRLVRTRVNLLDFLGRAEQSFAALPALHGLVDDAKNGESGMIFQAPAMLRAIKTKFAAEMGELLIEQKEDERAIMKDTWHEADPVNDDFATLFAEDPLFAELFLASATL